MTMAISIEHPYLPGPLPWRRGNLHTHTTNSDGKRTPQGIVDRYGELGYDFLCITDHDFLTDPAALDGSGLLLIPSVEVTAGGVHILHIGATRCIAPDPDRQNVIDAILADGGLPIVTHPNWESHFNHCPQANLEAWQRYAGIEVANGICVTLEGSGYAADRWDMLLGKGRRVWGYGTDDCHGIGTEGVAWSVVQSNACTQGAILDSLRAGRLYVSTGVRIERIAVSGTTITVDTADAERIAAVTDYGRRRGVVDGTSIVFDVPEDAPYSYVRFECYGFGDSMAWTQPFFICRT